MTAEPGSDTVGVVLTVPEPWGELLQERRAGYGDTMAWTIPTHLTLLPPTQVPDERLEAVDTHLAAVAAASAPFTLQLHGSGTFRPVTQTSYLRVRGGGHECAALADAVRTGPLRRRLPYPFHPHVTLAVDLADVVHDRVEAEMANFSAEFFVAELERYVLAEHGVWEPAAAFPLGA